MFVPPMESYCKTVCVTETLNSLMQVPPYAGRSRTRGVAGTSNEYPLSFVSFSIIECFDALTMDSKQYNYPRRRIVCKSSMDTLADS